MSQIFLTRHGQTCWNVERRMQGQQDSPLTDLGIRQGKALGKYLENEKIDIIYSSSSLRAVNTAEYIRGKRDIEIIKEDDLREIRLGSWEGLLFTEAEQEYPEQFNNFRNHPELYIPYGGETFFDLKERLRNKIDEIITAHPEKNILLVTHGVVLKTLFAYFKNLPEKEIASSPQPLSACFCEVKKEINGWDVIKWNETEHYQFI
jgi:probable phosphoglycerate mutase